MLPRLLMGVSPLPHRRGWGRGSAGTGAGTGGVLIRPQPGSLQTASLALRAGDAGVVQLRLTQSSTALSVSVTLLPAAPGSLPSLAGGLRVCLPPPYGVDPRAAGVLLMDGSVPREPPTVEGRFLCCDAAPSTRKGMAGTVGTTTAISRRVGKQTPG